MEQNEVLKLFEDTGALLNGHFQLRSGLHSPQFFQCAHLLQHPRISGRLCEALVEKMITTITNLDVDSVIAPAMGGITIGHDVAKALDKRFIFVEKENNALALRRFQINPGERFVIAEDVVTRGGRVQETIDIVHAHGGIVVGICILVNRSGGQTDFGIPMVSLLDISPEVYEPTNIPAWLEKIPLSRPGSK